TCALPICCGEAAPSCGRRPGIGSASKEGYGVSFGVAGAVGGWAADNARLRCADRHEEGHTVRGNAAVGTGYCKTEIRIGGNGACGIGEGGSAGTAGDVRPGAGGG